MFERILVPLDGSSLAECSVAHAVRMARTFGSEVHLLTVIEPRPGHHLLDGMEWRMVRAEARGYLARIAHRLQQHRLQVHTRVLEGRAADRSVDCVGEIDADMVLLTRHARGGLTGFSMSGTAFKIVNGAGVSVLLVQAGQHASEDPGYETVLAPVDCSRRSEWSAHLAANVALGAGAELVLATVVPTPELLGEAVEWSEQIRLSRRLVELNRKTAERHLRALAQQLEFGGLTVRIRLVEDPHVAPAIQRISEEEKASLVVIAAHGNSGHPLWSYGSVATRLLDRIRVPLIVFQDLHGSGRQRMSRDWRVRPPLRQQA